MAFYLNASRDEHRYGTRWSCYYHEGSTCTANGYAYYVDHYREVTWMERNLRNITQEHAVARAESEGDNG